jgi:hypothetical protein
VHFLAATAPLGSLGRTLTAIVGCYDETTLALLGRDVVTALGDKEDVAGLLREALPSPRVVAFGEEVFFVLSVVVVFRVFGSTHLCAAYRFGRSVFLIE